MRILLVDDDKAIRDSLEIILANEKDVTIVGHATNGKEAMSFVRKNKVDIILMDIRMPKMNGIEATANITKDFPNIKIIMLTTFKDFTNIHQALHAGAKGYIIKSDTVTSQIETIRNVHNGNIVLSNEVLQNMIQGSQDESLTNRENTCLELVANGYSNKEIAKRLFISEGTVRNVVSVILDKLNLRDRTQIAIYYWQTKKDTEPR